MFENKDTIKLIINIINKQNIDIDDIYDALNIGKKHTGYITNENSSDDESFYGYIDDDDKSFYSDDYYNDDDLLEYYHNQSQSKKNNQIKNQIDNQIKNYIDSNKCELIGKRDYNFHIKLNDHHLHENCNGYCNYNCKKNNYICGATYPYQFDKWHNPTQYKKCRYENDTNNCIHDCKGLIYKDDDNEYIIRFRYRLLSSKSFENNYWYFYLENEYWWYYNKNSWAPPNY